MIYGHVIISLTSIRRSVRTHVLSGRKWRKRLTNQTRLREDVNRSLLGLAPTEHP